MGVYEKRLFGVVFECALLVAAIFNIIYCFFRNVLCGQEELCTKLIALNNTTHCYYSTTNNIVRLSLRLHAVIKSLICSNLFRQQWK